jgi:hypothetical protein
MTCSSVKGDRRNRISVSGGSATGISENRPDMEIGVKSGDSRNSRDTRPDSAAVGWLHGCAATASTTDSFSSWIVVAGCFIVQALTIGSTYTFGVIYVDLLQEFGQSKAATAWIGSIQSALLYLTGGLLLFLTGAPAKLFCYQLAPPEVEGKRLNEFNWLIRGDTCCVR